VLWASTGVQPKEVWLEMDRRERLFGIAEKLQKRSAEIDRQVVAIESRRMQKRR